MNLLNPTFIDRRYKKICSWSFHGTSADGAAAEPGGSTLPCPCKRLRKTYDLLNLDDTKPLPLQPEAPPRRRCELSHGGLVQYSSTAKFTITALHVSLAKRTVKFNLNAVQPVKIGFITLYVIPILFFMKIEALTAAP